MEPAQFGQMVERLESQSAKSPGTYALRVALLTIVGFALLAAIVGVALAVPSVSIVVLAYLLISGKLSFAALYLMKVIWFLAIPAWFLLKSSASALFSRLAVPAGVEIKRSTAPELFAAISRMRKAM
jgi:hypothetical protein